MSIDTIGQKRTLVMCVDWRTCYIDTVETAMITTATDKGAMAKKKPETAQVRIAKDVIELARFVGAYHGQAPGDFISDYLRPRLAEMERDLLAQRSRQVAPAPEAKPKKGGK
jgi:hypothetical protein